MAICDNMKAIRRKKGMTQKQVAEACGLADSTIRTYELGNANPKPATVAKIAKALGVSAAELYGVDWMPGISVTLDQEANSALYQSLLSGVDPFPIDNPSTARLLVAFDRLNDDGQMEAIRRTEELAQIPAYQALPTGFSSDEIEALQYACQRILNHKYELELMEQDGVTKGGAVDSSHRCIESATEQIIDVMLKHFASLAPDRSIPPDRFLGKEYLKHMK